MKKFVNEWYVWENYSKAEFPLAVFDNYLDALFFAAQHMKENGKKAGVRGYGEHSWYYIDKVDNNRNEVTLMVETILK